MPAPKLYVLDRVYPLGETLVVRLCAARVIHPCYHVNDAYVTLHDGYHLDSEFVGFARLEALDGPELYDALVALAFSGIAAIVPTENRMLRKERPKLQALLEKAVQRVADMSPEERRAMMRAQKISWVYGELNMDCPPGKDRISKEAVAKLVDELK